MKIVVLTDTFPPRNQGGAGKIAFEYAKSFTRLGHTVTVVTTVHDRRDEGVSSYEGLEIRSLYSSYHERWIAYRSLYNPTTLGKVRRILKETRPDLVHVHNVHYHLSYHCLKLAKKSGATVVLTAHDVMLFHYGKIGGVERISPLAQLKKYKRRYNPFRNMLIKHYLSYVDKIVAVSRALEEILNLNGITNTTVIHNGIDVKDWKVDEIITRSFREKFDLSGKKVLLFGGRLSAAKGGEEAIRVLAAISGEYHDAILLIIGKKNDYADEMMRLAQSLGVGEQLMWTGWLAGEELKAAYHAAHIALVPSIGFDCLPTVILEAMACAKSVVATDLGGAKEMVVDGKTGYIINPRDIGIFGEKIKALLSDSVRLISFGTAGYERVKEYFNLETQARHFLALCGELQSHASKK